MNLGWVKLHRKLSDNKLWTSEPFTRGQAWVDMLILANHKEDFFYVRGNRVTVQRGQLGWSQLGLSKRWSWSRGKIKRFLNELETDQQIVQQNNFISSLITIVNYEQYQGDGQQMIQQTDSRRTADGQQTDTNKNVKNVKNEKNDKKEDKDSAPVKRFIKPSLEDVTAYCKERKNSIDPETFIAKCESNGWTVGKFQAPMKNWKSTIVTWEKNAKKDTGRTFI